MQSKALNHKLDQYSAAARGQTARGKSVAELAGYAAAAGASLAMAGSADAAIIYSGVQNVIAQIDPTAQATGSTFQNVDAATFTMGGSVFHPIVGNAGALGGPSAKYLGRAILSASNSPGFLAGNGVANFLSASHADIGPGGNFLTASSVLLRRRFNRANRGVGSVNNSSAGNFAPGATGIVGVQLRSGDYGWIRLRVDDLGLNQPFSTILAGAGGAIGNGLNYPDKITVIDWAYEDSGAAIHAGAVPEPSSLALLAAGAAGVSAFRRRKAAKTAH
jgi:hypothetical protein